MSYLNTKTLAVGSKTFILSEFTALDRIRDLQYVAKSPTMEKPGAEATDQERMAYGVFMEELTLDQVAHSIALSLSHANENLEDQSVEALHEMVKEKWPNRSVNTAYDMIKELNMPEKTNDTTPGNSESQEELTPEK